MRKCFLLSALVLGMVPGSTAQAEDLSPVGHLPPHHPNRIIVKPFAMRERQALNLFQTEQRSRIERRFADLGGIEVVELAPGVSVANALQQYRNSGLYEFAEPDYKLYSRASPNDPLFTSGGLWGLHNTLVPGADIGASAAWDLTRSASNIIVAVVDTGIRTTHEDLAANLWRNPKEIPGTGRDDDGNGFIDDVHGIDAIRRTGNPWDRDGHGTHVAGTIGAVGNNGKGIVGVAWNVQIMGLKFMDPDPSGMASGHTSDAIACIDYARHHGAHIINASWGGPNHSRSLRTALQRARDAGIIVVAAAGNASQNIDLVPDYPAAYGFDNMVVVAATTSSDNFESSYSNYGAQRVHLGAPGSGIISTWHTADDAYMTLSGTSMAAPHVAGALALIKARFPHESHQQTIRRLLDAVDPLPSLAGRCSTGGRLNLARALGSPSAAIASPRVPRLKLEQINGLLSLEIAGDPHREYALQASNDLVRWETIATGTTGAGGVLMLNGNAPQDGNRFFRAAAAQPPAQ